MYAMIVAATALSSEVDAIILYFFYCIVLSFFIYSSSSDSVLHDARIWRKFSKLIWLAGHTIHVVSNFGYHASSSNGMGSE